VLASALAPPGTPCAAHGQPESVSLDVVSRDAGSAVVELRTGGFYAVGEPGGAVRVFVPGFDQPRDALSPALPLRRTLVDAVVGREARLAAVEASSWRRFPGLRPAAVGRADLDVGADGTVRPSRRHVALARAGGGLVPAEPVRLAGAVFQGETKREVVEISPVRYDAGRDELVLAGLLRLRLAFTGRAAGEEGEGRTGRRPTREAPVRHVLAELHTTRRGLHAAGFDRVFPGRLRPIPLETLRLQRQGAAVPFHVEPALAAFGPGATLYFHADAAPSSTAFAGEVAWQLVRSAEGVRMGSADARPSGGLAAGFTTRVELERDRIHMPGLLEAEDPWLWEAVPGRGRRAVAFRLESVDAGGGLARLEVRLQGGSDAPGVVDHHVRVLVNGVPAGRATFDGKRPLRLPLTVSASALREGENELAIENVGDTGVHSMVFLDRFLVDYPRRAAVGPGGLEGAWESPGVAEVEVAAPPVVVDVTDPAVPVWLTGLEPAPGAVRFSAGAGRRYVVAPRGGLPAPRVALPVPTAIVRPDNRADFLVIGPASFLEAARPLVERREGQGLSTRFVSLEEIASAFGGGEPSAEAVRAFLAHAFHSWARPSPRYALLLGDGSDDPRNRTGTALPAPLPALRVRTSYLWTASDPMLAAVNGDDPFPDLAIGRLPAATAEEAARLVAKVLDWEDARHALDGEAVVVADDPDEGGDFEANARDVAAGPLAGRPTTTLLLRELGTLTRAAIFDAFSRGPALLSYVGHGGAAVWASENVLNTWDAPALPAQPRQPVLLTLNCLNGYFTAPGFDALTEALLKADGRGVVAGVSPSGVSLDAPAHAYHRALLGALATGGHERLGDAFLAAQEAYALAGVMPELVSVYHLFGDPTMRIRR
jgi:hypothetical protein